MYSITKSAPHLSKSAASDLTSTLRGHDPNRPADLAPVGADGAGAPTLTPPPADACASAHRTLDQSPADPLAGASTWRLRHLTGHARS